jgi:citrate synthase
MDSAPSTTQTKKPAASARPGETLTVTDNRTGKSYELPITHGTIRAADLRQIKVDANDFGMMSYDPAFNNTASCISRVTYIDGDVGILRYRGYPIEDLAHRWRIEELVVQRHASHVCSREHQEVSRRLSL